MHSESSNYELEELLEIIQEKTPSSEEIYVLETYAVYFIQPLLKVRIDISELEPVECEFSQDLALIDTVWPCPLLFSLLNFDELIMCILALVKEESLVFISKNMGFISSCVLGLHSLIKPFPKNYVISPILPEQIKEILQASLPLLVGVCFNIERKKTHVHYIELDSESTVKIQFKATDYKELKEKCRKDYELFCGRPCYIPNDIQQIASFRIINNIKAFLD